MHSLFLIFLCAGLCCATSDSQPENLEILMDNVLVLRVPTAHGTMTEVPLTCGDAYQNKPVFWKKNGKAFTPALEGNKVKVLVKEMNGGNYSCHLHLNGEYLNHTVVMVRLKPDNRTVILEKESPAEGHIHCSAPNYNGSFHCTWKRTQYRTHAAVLLVKAERFTEEIPCVLDADGSGVSCQDASCSYNEEQHRISLTIYMHSYSRLEGYTKSFYLRDIVRPAQLPNLHISSGRVFSWDYPDSWEKPCTYFGLHFQVKAVPSGHFCHSEEFIMNNTTDKAQYEVNIKTKKYVFCVRAQDKHTMGPWSHWSQFKVNKNDVKY
ncbi:interleukin-12 subunit beta [Melanotaenia boesemani]|uniref:interleukin-12 subunit beta n=1 Tax=Melanotaenia boesemani TaxID=1250792 RepID=UPI001C04B37C|nr:interleukin-12 subunit beta [Melanotaenia boesemani]XP_041865141.1 interleukin-12 subunit beta [Melanotaenia boesemani]